MTIFTLERVSNPDIEPVTLSEMKTHLRTFASDASENSLISSLIVVAREWLEDYVGCALIDQEWRLTLENDHHNSIYGNRIGGYPGCCGYYSGIFLWGRIGEIKLRKSPLLSITSFVSVDAAGIETDIDPSGYELREANSKWPRLVALNGATWAANRTLRVRYRAGFSNRLGSPPQDESAVPDRYKQAIKLHVEAMYDRDPVMMPLLIKTAESLIKSDRSELSMA